MAMARPHVKNNGHIMSQEGHRERERERERARSQGPTIPFEETAPII
jgi:hypothetical protein